ncbi:MAG TPA: NAD-dependent epimerase/dehydratase family protein [Kineosporiaceae bacterium]
MHLIFGSGPIGLATLDALRRRGESVRIVNRTGHAPVPEDVEVVAGDAADPDFCVRVARGADVVYQVLSPAYHRWSAEFPALQAAILAAAQATGARLVSLENVYMYGRYTGKPFTEDSPWRPHTRKGMVRAAMARELLAAHEAGRASVVIARASDYFGPRGESQSNLGERVLGPALHGGTARVLGDPDQPHTYTYLPDIGEGLAALGAHPAAVGRVWHLPNDPTPHTTRELVDALYHLAGRAPARIQGTPAWQLRLAGLFNPGARETVEMLYEFTEPFLVDSREITTRLGLRATPLEQALKETLASYRRAGSAGSVPSR